MYANILTRPLPPTVDEIRLLTLSDALSGRKGYLVRLLMRVFVA